MSPPQTFSPFARRDEQRRDVVPPTPPSSFQSRFEEITKRHGGVLQPTPGQTTSPTPPPRAAPVSVGEPVPSPAPPSSFQSRFEEITKRYGGVLQTPQQDRAPRLRPQPAGAVSPPLAARAPVGVTPAPGRGPEDVTFSQRIGAGIDRVQSHWGSFLQWGGETAEALTQTETPMSKALQDIGEDIAARNLAEAEPYPSLETTSIDSPAAFGRYLKGLIGEQIPVMGPIMAGAATGAAIGSIVPGVGTTIGGLLGGLSVNLPMHIGIQQAAVKERDPELERPGAVFAGGTAMAALDLILPARIGGALVRRFGPNAAREIATRMLTTPVAQKFLVRAGRGAVTGMLTEGVTEALQEAIEDVTANYASQIDSSLPQAIMESAKSPELRARMWEAGFAGGALGWMSGGVGGAISGSQPTPPYTPEAEPEPTPEQAATFFQGVGLEEAPTPGEEVVTTPGEEVVTPQAPLPLEPPSAVAGAPTPVEVQPAPAEAPTAPEAAPIGEPAPAVEPTPAVVTPAEAQVVIPPEEVSGVPLTEDIPDSVPQRLREGVRERSRRESAHNAEIDALVVAAAKRIDPSVDELAVLAELRERRRFLSETTLEGEEYSSDSLLRAIAKGGGIRWENVAYGGEIADLREGHRGGNVQRPTGRSIPVFRSTGLTPDGTVEYLSQDARWNDIVTIPDLLERLGFAIRDQTTGSNVFPGTKALRKSGIDLSKRWWADEPPVREAVVEEAAEPALTYDQYVAASAAVPARPDDFAAPAYEALDEANPAHAATLAQAIQEYQEANAAFTEAQAASRAKPATITKTDYAAAQRRLKTAAAAVPESLRSRGTEDAALLTPARVPPADVLDTGEVQDRLPEAGAVREQEITTPEVVEDVPFALRRQARDDRLEAPTLFGTSPLVPGEPRRAEEASAATYEFTDPLDPQSGAAPGGEVQPTLELADVTPAPYGTGSDPATKPSPLEFPEVVLMARQLILRVPRIVKQFRGDPKFARFVAQGDQARIEMLSDLFKEGNEFKLAAALSHELGHAIDWLPEYVLRRGNLLGRLQSLRSLQGSFTTPDGRRITNSTILKEAKAFSAAWRPWDRATASKKEREYRDSATELYADLISGLLVRPRMVEARAPTFYKTFFDLLDRKPKVAESYMGIQDLLSGTREELVRARRKRITQGFEAGTIKMREIQERRLEERAESQSPSGFWARLRREYFDPHYWADWTDKLEAMGIAVGEEGNIYFQLQEQNYIGGKLKTFNDRYLFPIYRDVTKNGIDWNSFGESLLYERIIDGDRSDKANPDGITPADAKERYAHLREALGPEKVQILDEQLVKFRNMVQDVSLRGYRAGLYSDALYASMYKNKAYAMFQAVEHIEEEVTAHVFGQVGMTGQIRNPADATFARMFATLTAIERNKLIRNLEREFTRHFGSAIEPAKTKGEQRGGRYVQVPQEPEDSRYGLLTYLDKGRRVGFYVEAYVAESVKRTSIGHSNTAIEILSKINSGWFRPVFITFNLGFMGVNIVRDFNRFWKNIPGMTIARAMRRYLQAVPFARVRSFGMPKNPTAAHKAAYEDLLDAQGAGMLSVSYSDTMAEKYDYEVGALLRAGRDPDVEAPAPRPLLRPILAILDTVQKLGNFIETLPKAAGIYELRGEGEIKDLTIRQRAAIRLDIGSPDFQIRGKWTPLLNNLFLFSNAMIQGVRSDVRIALDPKRPKTLGLSGWWWKTIGANIIPKVFMMAALYGFLGDTLRRFYERVTEYDRINYIPIPLFWGENGEGNVTYFRMPQGDAGRVVGAVFYLAGMSGANGRKFISGLVSVLDYTSGQMPSITPMISGPKSILEMATGQNPRDQFRGRNVLTADEQSARGWPAWKKFLGWEFQQLGGGVIWRFYPGERIPERKTLGQTIIELPILSTVLGRFIRITQYGDTERIRNAVELVRTQAARGRLAERSMVNNVVRDLQQGVASGEGLDMLSARIALDAYGEDLTRATERVQAIRNRLETTAVRAGVADPFLDAYLAARSIRERVAVATEWVKSRR